MHQDNKVSVFTAGPSDRGGSPAGVGWLVTPSVVLMRQSGRGATPGLPSHITLPAVSGGGRGAHADSEQIHVLGVHDPEAPELDGWVALQLDRECELPGTGALPQGIDLGGLTMADLTAPATTTPASTVASFAASDHEVNVSGGLLCRWFPSLPGCRR